MAGARLAAAWHGPWMLGQWPRTTLVSRWDRRWLDVRVAVPGTTSSYDVGPPTIGTHGSELVVAGAGELQTSFATFGG
jgi:hypothetical protein